MASAAPLFTLEVIMQGFTSELDAVNKIIAVDGSSPIQTLEDSYIQAQIARQLLTRVSRTLQSKGWWFNEEENVTLVPDLTGHITLGLNVSKCMVKNVNGTVIQRGQKLYDRQERTYNFTQPVTADLVLALNWTELPEEARIHISDLACIEYNRSYFGAQDIKSELENNVVNSLVALKNADTEGRNINLMDNARTHNIAFKNRNRRA